jgi:hypothetical protein
MHVPFIHYIFPIHFHRFVMGLSRVNVFHIEKSNHWAYLTIGRISDRHFFIKHCVTAANSLSGSVNTGDGAESLTNSSSPSETYSHWPAWAGCTNVFFVFGVEWNWAHYYWGHYWPIVPAPDDDEWWSVWNSRWNVQRKPASVPLCVPQIPHDLTRAQTQAVVVGNQQLTAWAVTWPSKWFFKNYAYVQILIWGSILELWLHHWGWEWYFEQINRGDDDLSEQWLLEYTH